MTEKKQCPGALGDAPEKFNLMQRVKRRMYALRNGAVAEQMRNYGLTYFLNFGLNMPQIKQIAADILREEQLSDEERVALAMELWRNERTRESRLLAPLLLVPEELSPHLAEIMLREAQTPEIADHLCLNLLRRLPFAESVAYSALQSAANDIQHYAALRLLMNLLCIGKADTSRLQIMLTQIEPTPLCQPLLNQIHDELDFLKEC